MPFFGIIHRMKHVTNLSKKMPHSVTEDVSGLQKTLAENQQQLKKKDRQIEQLLDYIQVLRQKRFGQSSEKVSQDQINLFDESELEQLQGELDALSSNESSDEDKAEKDELSTAEKTKKQTPRRRPLPANLTRVERIIDVSPTEKALMKDNWTLIGYDTSETLAVIPRQHYVVQIKRAKYAPNNENVLGAERGIITAAQEKHIIPKSIADASVIADVVTAKFVDGLPFYRQEKIYQRDGINLSRQTMSSWVIQLEAKLKPLMCALKKHLYSSSVLHIDETRLQVLNEPDKDNAQQSYMWVYKGGQPKQPIVWYQYADGRQSSVPLDFLYPAHSDEQPDEYQKKHPPDHGINIMTDGYAGYNALSKHPNINHHAVCWAHARRKFVEASKGRKNTAAAHQIVALIAKLYQIEREAKDSDPEQRLTLRKEKSTLIIEKIKTWLDSKVDKVLPKSLLGKAVHYTLNLWSKLTVYLTDADLPIDNNAAENAIRPFVIGRKAWLFSGSPRGAEASATLYSLIETAKANELEPRAYLNYLFERLPKIKSEKELDGLLPLNLKMSDLVR